MAARDGLTFALAASRLAKFPASLTLVVAPYSGPPRCGTLHGITVCDAMIFFNAPDTMPQIPVIAPVVG